MPAPLTAKETCNFLSYSIEQILGTNGIDVLGQYQLFSKENLLDTIPSIKIDYPLVKSEVIRKFVPESGIEVTIVNQPDYIPARFKGGHIQVIKYFMIYLDQHDPLGVVDDAIEALYTRFNLDLQPNPTVFPARLKPDHSGVLPPRAIMYLRQNKFVLSKI